MRASPRMSSRLPRMLPVIDALTSSTSPARSATMAMISSAALPKVALSSPPIVGPGAVRQVLGGLAHVAGQRQHAEAGGEEDPDGGRVEHVAEHDAHRHGEQQQQPPGNPPAPRGPGARRGALGSEGSARGAARSRRPAQCRWPPGHLGSAHALRPGRPASPRILRHRAARLVQRGEQQVLRREPGARPRAPP